MKELNIGKIIITKRKEKGITQEDLAVYIGVSKASVSKWETCQSYPDITFLPQLAAYFNISIDELIGYSPQMTKEDIKKLYHRLSSNFSSRPFDETLAECRGIIKKYYSCFPLLLQMVILLLNHYMLAKDQESQEKLIHEIIALCVRIKVESDDVWLSKQANSLEATCQMVLQQPIEVLELLDGTMKPLLGDEAILSAAYQMTGNLQKAKSVLQISIYQHLLIILGVCPNYLLLHVSDTEKFEEILHRILSVSQVFEIDTLHPNASAQLYFAAAQGYAMQDNKEKSLKMLSKYADICTTNFFPLKLHGDEFFDCIEEWFDDFDLGAKAPRDEKVIKDSMIDAIISNPVFSALMEDPKYKIIIETMKLKLGGN
ncbi:helix-turn-helix domain-containing protein [Alkalibaculum sp. M08DMB]|uniref:Helix-turn-helix domain-containing protein n=1 Tax=Alkalibaculum sporogenes TaxID=2655001 RepID=A0A6A7K4Q5_9FIRM|nr:helix-turn-helix transcriptional regulator [Alkalibaculum sporogenes]MPW24368.1 helix-turn-helix domain-containing protein [Alkalibaculum sporogenes]